LGIAVKLTILLSCIAAVFFHSQFIFCSFFGRFTLSRLFAYLKEKDRKRANELRSLVKGLCQKQNAMENHLKRYVYKNA